MSRLYMIGSVVCLSLFAASESSAQPKPAIPLPDLQQPLWSRPTVADMTIFGRPERGSETSKTLKSVLPKNTVVPFVSGGMPILGNDLCVYTSYLDVRAVALLSKKTSEEEIERGSIWFKSVSFSGRATSILEDNGLRGHVFLTAPKIAIQPNHGRILAGNSRLGWLTHNDKYVFTVDEFAFPIAVKCFTANIWPQIRHQVKTLSLGNVVRAFSFKSGKVVWGLGNPGSEGLFSKAHFLHAPLSHQGKLFVIAECNAGPTGKTILQLICLNTDVENRFAQHTPKVRWKTELRMLPLWQRTTHNHGRKIHATPLTAHKNLLICPTHAGSIIAVDIKKRKPVWNYVYRKEGLMEKKPTDEFVEHWQVPRVVVHKDRIVFTGPDDPHVWCVSLDKGKLLWKAKQDGDIYMAGVFANQVFLVGKNNCRALTLAKGEQTWKTKTGVPGGIGALSKTMYYVPLRQEAKSKKPGIVVIDVAQGNVLARVITDAKNEPGNLVLYDGGMISQTALRISAYRMKRK